jgi:hypothetical protein
LRNSGFSELPERFPGISVMHRSGKVRWYITRDKKSSDGPFEITELSTCLCKL